MRKLESTVLSTLEGSDQGMTLKEIAEKIGESEKKVFKILRKFFENGVVDTENHRYKLTKKP